MSSMVDSGVWSSKNSQLTITTGAKSQAALHSTCSTVMRWSAVVSPGCTPRCSQTERRISSPPRVAHRVFVQTPTRYSPVGVRRYIE